MDNFEVKEGPSCIKPTNLEVTNIEPYQAGLSWMANGEESAWTVYYKKSSDTEYSSVNVNTTSSYTLENLQPGTKYQFYVVANCSENEERVHIHTIQMIAQSPYAHEAVGQTGVQFSRGSSDNDWEEED